MKRIRYVILLFLGIVPLLYFGINLFAQYQIKKLINDKVQKGELHYTALELNLWKGNARVDSIQFLLKDNKITADQLSVHNTNLFGFLIKNEINIDKIQISNPQFELHQKEKEDPPKEKKAKTRDFNKKLRVDTIEVAHLHGSLWKDTLEIAKLVDYHIRFEKFKIDRKSWKEKIPFQFSKGEIKGKQVEFYSKTEKIKVDSIAMDQKKISLHSIHSQPYRDKESYKSEESDGTRSEFYIGQVNIEDYAFDFESKKPRLIGSEFAIDSLLIDLYGYKANSKKQRNPESFSLPLEFEIKKLDLNHIDLIYKEIQSTGFELTVARLENYALQVFDIFPQEAEKQKLPVQYKNFALKGKELVYHLNLLQTLRADSIYIDTKTARMHQIRLLPNFSRSQYTRFIPYEKDLMDIHLELLEVPEYELIWSPEVSFTSPKVHLKNMEMQVYRDKRARDDFTKKDLYSKMLRELPAEIAIDSLHLEKANISYEEVQEKNGATGKVFFNNLDLKATSLTNSGLDRTDFPATQIDITTLFMGSSALSVHWNFKINDESDRFAIKGTARNISPKAINSFLTPAFNIQSEGIGVDYLNFNFNGNNVRAGGNFKMEYRNLRFTILRKRDGERNRILSLATNLIVPRQRTVDDKRVQVNDVQRDPTKSFWNYLWKCVADGLKHTVI